MPRVARSTLGGIVYHVLNRGNNRGRLFEDDDDYAAFVRLLAQARVRVGSVGVLGWCIMPNHWHLVLHPRRGADDALSKFMGWLTNAHVRQWHAHRHSVGRGHVYQGRFKSFPVKRDEHLLTVLRYVESNPIRGAVGCRPLAKQAQDWRWSSFGMRYGDPAAWQEVPGGVPLLSELVDGWPVDRPRNWAVLVNREIEKPALEAVRHSLSRGTPLGDARWVRQTAEALSLTQTLNPRGRPRKQKAADG